MGFFELQWDVWGFSRVMKGNSGSLSCGPREAESPFELRGEHGIALELWQGNRASSCVEGGISRSFWSCSRKPWLPSTCDSDLRELLRLFMGNQEFCGIGGASRDSSGVSAKEEGLISN